MMDATKKINKFKSSQKASNFNKNYEKQKLKF